jgi:hypothetical protein
MALVRTAVSEERIASMLVPANVVPRSSILVTLMMEAISSSDRFFERPHGVTSQKTAFFIVTAVKTPYLTYHS